MQVIWSVGPRQTAVGLTACGLEPTPVADIAERLGPLVAMKFAVGRILIAGMFS